MGRLITLGTFALDDVLPHIAEGAVITVSIVEDGQPRECTVNVNSVRLQCFQKNLSCVRCGVTGTQFLLQRHVGSQLEIPHFNLYAKDDEGELVLMTKDHILPASKGGSNAISNMQTMCMPCNVSKSTKATLYIVCGDKDVPLRGFAKKSRAQSFLGKSKIYREKFKEAVLALMEDKSLDEILEQDGLTEIRNELVPGDFREAVNQRILTLREIPLG
jgi:hypothetical protein